MGEAPLKCQVRLLIIIALKVIASAAYLYEAVMMWATALNKAMSLPLGNAYHDLSGMKVTQLMRNIQFEGAFTYHYLYLVSLGRTLTPTCTRKQTHKDIAISKKFGECGFWGFC